MTDRRTAPPLLPPPAADLAARALSRAARTAASEWDHPMEPTRHDRAVCQLYSVLRDLSIATKGLAHFQITGGARIGGQRFRHQVAAVSELLLEASDSLDGVLAGRRPDPLPDDSDPGAALYQAVRQAIRAWRQPTGTITCRDTTIEHLVTALGALAQGARGLADRAPPVRNGQLRAIHDRLGAAIFCLAGALEDQVPMPPNRKAQPDGRGGAE